VVFLYFINQLLKVEKISEKRFFLVFAMLTVMRIMTVVIVALISFIVMLFVRTSLVITPTLCSVISTLDNLVELTAV